MASMANEAGKKLLNLTVEWHAALQQANAGLAVGEAPSRSFDDIGADFELTLRSMFNPRVG